LKQTPRPLASWLALYLLENKGYLLYWLPLIAMASGGFPFLSWGLKRWKIGVSFLSVFLLLSSVGLGVSAERADEILFSGTVRDYVSREPIPNVHVIVYETYPEIKLHSSIFTSQNGTYETYLFSGRSYRIYFLHKSPIGSYDYIPARYPISGSLEPTSSSIFAEVLMFPGYVVRFEGSINYVNSSRASSSFKMEVVDFASKSTLGQLEDIGGMTAYGTGSPDVIYTIEDEKMAILPAGLRVLLKITSTIYDSEADRYRLITFYVDDQGNGFSYLVGHDQVRVITSYSLKASLLVTQSVIDRAFDDIRRYESMGFYLASERDDLAYAQRLFEEARISLSEEDDLNSFIQMRQAFIMVKQTIYGRIEESILVAKTGSLYLPFFISVFSISLAFFFFEDDKRKVLSSFVIFLLLMGLFIMIYPGFRIQDPVLLAASSVASVILGTAIVFLIPRVWKEPAIERGISTRAALVVLFSMAKRNLKRRRTRTFFAMLNLATLVMAFTALTSFSSIYGLTSEDFPSKIPIGLILLKGIPKDATSPYGKQFVPFTDADVQWVSSMPYVVSVSPLAQNSPSLGSLLEVSVNDKDFVSIYGIIGIDPLHETKVTGLVSSFSNQITDKEARSGDWVAISSSLLKQTGAKIGDKLSVRLAAGEKRTIGKYTVVSVVDYDSISRLKDLNGESFLPNYIPSPEAKESTPTDLFIVLDWRKAIEVLSVGVYRLIVETTSDGKDLESQVRNLVFGLEADSWYGTSSYSRHSFLAKRIEMKGVESYVILLSLVALNVGAIMLNVVEERRKEIRSLMALGPNPTHIAILFLAEAAIQGLIAGGLGYVGGLLLYRALGAFAPATLLLRAKMEWYWSVIGVTISLIVALASASRPALAAAVQAAPSMILRARVTEEQLREREERLRQLYQPTEVSLPIKVRTQEMPFFDGFMRGRVEELQAGFHSWVQDISSEFSETKGVWILRFEICFREIPEIIGAKVDVQGSKDPETFEYKFSIRIEPMKGKLPDRNYQEITNMFHDICMNWARNKSKLMGATP